MGWSFKAEEEPVYSTVAIGRYIGDVPEISFNNSTYTVKIEDLYKTERIYSYHFILKYNDIVLEDSGEILNTNNIEISDYVLNL